MYSAFRFSGVSLFAYFFLANLTLASLIFFFPLVSALTFGSIPSNLTSGGPATFTWTSDAGDPSTVSLELLNVAFNNAFAIGNNIPVSDGTISVTLPIVPSG